jgi:heme exporter protein A
MQTMTDNQALSLRVGNLTCVRNNRTLFDDLSFSLHSGEIMIIGGDNGSGKTTLLKLLCGLTAPDKGHIKLNQQSISDLGSDYYSKQLLYLSHEDEIKLDLSARENLILFCRHYEQPVEFVSDILDKIMLENEADIPCRDLSAGQNRRVALARLLISQAPIWILDEPLTALDETGIALVKQLLHIKLQRKGMIILSSHHDINIDEGIGMQRLSLTPSLQKTAV